MLKDDNSTQRKPLRHSHHSLVLTHHAVPLRLLGSRMPSQQPHNTAKFKQATTELLWSPQIQSQVRCSIYQDSFNKSGDESLRIFYDTQ